MADSDSDTPTIDAIFVVRFDTRQGNVLEWSNSTPGIQLTGVEYSALPSGLHTTPQDVIYFQLEGCVGVAVFKNAPADREEHRGARMISVGVLVKPSADTGRCGQVWRHIDFLKSRAGHHVIEGSETADLSDYFTTHKTPASTARPSSSSSTKRDSYRAMSRRRISRSFTLSEPVQALQPGSGGMLEHSDADEIPLSHPSHQFLQLVESFGPSVYTLWKSALSRKRILIYTPPPIESTCLAVYNICLMATIPSGEISLAQTRSNERLQPLFCVGIHDIDHMSSLRGGFVACTTEKLFLFKLHLFDLIVDLSASSRNAVAYPSPKEAHPRLSIVKEIGTEYALEATEPYMADHRRYFALMQQLARYQRRQDWMQKRLVEEISEAEANRDGGDGDARTLENPDHHRDGSSGSTARRQGSRSISSTGGFNMSDTLGMMLTGGWWWWYGSDDAEAEDYEPLIPNKSVPGQVQQDGEEQRRSGARIQVLQMQTSGSSSTEAIRCFHNLTRTVLLEMSRLIAFKTTAAIFDDPTEFSFSSERRSADETTTASVSSTSAGALPPLQLSRHDVQQLGLDPSREGKFVEELSQIYFNADVRVQEGLLRGWIQSFGGCCSTHTASCCYLCG
ncbi:hypothetical protein BG015_009275 [Linnemannia schmuckeri]|uniref:DUF4484 domain-containing protein n=1 Tax=Linnemannia schmuckeri TaxID=64567 RepID=A0A9P5RY88_9FUNG|nr:hypothetical protein BG015_009275 [Linnemannia schmuckeri]